MQWFTTLAVSSSLLCLSLWDKCTAGKTNSRAWFAPVHSTAQWFCGNVLRQQLMKKKRDPRLEKEWQPSKAVHCLHGEHRLFAQQQVHTGSSQHVCQELLQALSWGTQTSLCSLQLSQFTQARVSYGHLGNRYESTSKRRSSLESGENFHVLVG